MADYQITEVEINGQVVRVGDRIRFVDIATARCAASSSALTTAPLMTMTTGPRCVFSSCPAATTT